MATPFDAAGEEALPPGGSGGKGRVLVLEDDQGISQFLATALEGDGYEVVRRESALGLEVLLQHWHPEVILLDLSLSYRSGATLLTELKADSLTAAIPVVVIADAPKSVPQEHAALATAVLPKPVSLQTLLAAVRAAQAGDQ